MRAGPFTGIEETIDPNALRHHTFLFPFGAGTVARLLASLYHSGLDQHWSKVLIVLHTAIGPLNIF